MNDTQVKQNTLDQDTFLAEVGELVLERALQRLFLDLSDDEKNVLEQMLEKTNDATSLLEALEKAHPQFTDFFEEEAALFRSRLAQAGE